VAEVAPHGDDEVRGAIRATPEIVDRRLGEGPDALLVAADLAAEGVVQAETYLQVGEVIRPVRLDGDRRGYVIAVADTNMAALDRAEAAARLLRVEVEA
jgi:hypothetical protein